jgi:hypothetical protein
VLSAWATPTPYQPAVYGEGYGEQQLERGRYRVWFAGNTVTPRATVENHLLYRAAEATVETGHRWFRIIDQDTEAETTYYTKVAGFPVPRSRRFPTSIARWARPFSRRGAGRSRAMRRSP